MEESDGRLERCFRDVLERMDAPVLVTDARLDGAGPTIRYANPAFARLAGLAPGALLGRTTKELDCAGPCLVDEPDVRAALERGTPVSPVSCRRGGDEGRDGRRWRVTPVSDERGVVSHLVAVDCSVDTAGRMNGAADPLDRQVFERHCLVMLLIDPDSGEILDANDAAASFYGHERDALRGMNIDRINTLSTHEVRAEMARARRLDVNSFVFRHRLASGEERAVEVYSTPVAWGGREVLHSIIHDISERERLAHEVEERLYFDALTGLPNRTLFRTRIDAVLDRAQRRGGRAAVMHLDLDRFRDLNEVWGHDNGDELLCQVAAVLHEALPDADVIARLAGDEIGIAMLLADPQWAVDDLAEQVQSAFHAAPFRVAGRDVRLYASIGIALYPEDDTVTGGLMRHAEAALIHAKRRGGDQWARYDPAQSGDASERVLLGGELRGALEAGRLSLALQPIVDMRDGREVGAEALARWSHPEHGWIPPDRFIRVAEATGQIGALGDWVLRTAAAHAVPRAAGGAWRIAVNVSALQLRRANLAGTIARVLAETGLPAPALEVELTESALIAEDDRLIAGLEAIRALGVGVAIDDFGTGYSSLQYLKRLPVDRIKIDRSFVRDMDTDMDNHAIVATIAALANQFGLGLTAEGVETRAEAEALLALGCHRGQGFHFAVPQVLDPPGGR